MNDHGRWSTSLPYYTSVLSGGETYLMTAGDLVYIAPNTVHSAEDAHVLFIDQPGGYEESEQRERSFTPEQLAQPQTQHLLRELSDIYPVAAPGSAREKR
jgi:hypothetical protein